MSISIFNQVSPQPAHPSAPPPRLPASLKWGLGAQMALGVVVVLLVAQLATALVCLSLVRRAASGAPLEGATIATAQTALRVTARLYTVAFCCAAVVWLIWLYRAYNNLTFLGTGQTTNTPGEAVGLWFAPVLNLVVPFRIVRELWARSSDLNAGTEPNPLARTEMVSLWWSLYLVSSFIALVSLRPSLAKPLGPANFFAIMTAWLVLRTAAAVLAILIVRRISGFQQRILIEPNFAETFS